MFLYVFSEIEKEMLIDLGFKFINKSKIGNKETFIFEDNKKKNFDNNRIKVFRTNKLYF